MTERSLQGNNPTTVAATGIEFKIKDTKLYVPVVRLSKKKMI